MAKQKKTAITPTRGENYPEWYQQVVRAADLAENSDPRFLSASAPATLNAGNTTGPPGDGSRTLGAHPYEVVGQRVPVCSR